MLVKSRWMVTCCDTRPFDPIIRFLPILISPRQLTPPLCLSGSENLVQKAVSLVTIYGLLCMTSTWLQESLKRDLPYPLSLRLRQPSPWVAADRR
ncbi:hypothetical protein BDV06DRAFT_204648 [Aspergillus oleicola]